MILWLTLTAKMQKNRFHNKWQYLYIESVCNDPQVLEQNYRYKMMYSPDYKDVNTEEVRHDESHCATYLSCRFGTDSC